MTLANRLTLARAFLGLVTFGCLWTRRPDAYALALILYVMATITDGVDGYIARKTASVSPFGAIADPIADKILVIGALIAFLHIRDLGIPIWAVFLIIVRDLIIGGLRSLSGARGKVVAADQMGKLKMGIQSGSVLMILILLVLRATCGMALPAWTKALPFYLVLISLVATWISAVLYLHQSRRLLRASWNAPNATD